jgi:hypothetical protein
VALEQADRPAAVSAIKPTVRLREYIGDMGLSFVLGSSTRIAAAGDPRSVGLTQTQSQRQKLGAGSLRERVGI